MTNTKRTPAHFRAKLEITPPAIVRDGEAWTHAPQAISSKAQTSPGYGDPQPTHLALKAIARLLGKQAAAHVHKHRFEGLGRIELIRLQDEARSKSNNSDNKSINSSNTS